MNNSNAMATYWFVMVGCLFSMATHGILAQSTELLQEPNSKATSLGTLVIRASRDGEFVTPPVNELSVARDLFQRTIFDLIGWAEVIAAESHFKASEKVATKRRRQSIERLERTRDRWQSLQMSFEQIGDGKESVWILSENSDARRGRGFFAFRPQAKRRLVIQAPHSFFDKHTRAINAHIFESGEVFAACWNTVRREQADLAHQRYHYLNEFTAALADTMPNVAVAQLHGFSPKNRKTKAGRAADIIVSDGTKTPSSQAFELVRALRKTSNASRYDLFRDSRVLLFPTECQELGATTNVQAQLLRDFGNQGFLHLEMSPRFRNGLRRDASVRDEFLKSLLSIYRH